MMTFFLICACFPLSGLVFHLLTKKYLNPYKLTFIFGKKGSGKSTLLTRFAIEYQKKGWNVYSTEPIPGCYLIDYKDIGVAYFPPNSCIIIDEVGMIWDNRNFKTFPPHVRDYFKLQRHHKHTVIMASQTFDVDKKIRDLADNMYLVENKFRVFTYAKRILRRVVLIEAQAGKNGESRIDENLVFDSLLWFWCGSRKLTFIPKYAVLFNSFSLEKLLEKPFEKLPDRKPLTARDVIRRSPSFIKKEAKWAGRRVKNFLFNKILRSVIRY